jgi:ABC-type multidrug transport system fused ATPase/permease subunit
MLFCIKSFGNLDNLGVVMLYPRLASLAMLVIGTLLTYLLVAVLPEIHKDGIPSFAFSLASMGVLTSFVIAICGFYGVLTSFGIERSGAGFRLRDNHIGKLLAWLKTWFESAGKERGNTDGETEGESFCALSGSFALAGTLVVMFTVVAGIMAYTAFTDWEKFVDDALEILPMAGMLFVLTSVIWHRRFPRLAKVVIIVGGLPVLGFALYVTFLLLYDALTNGFRTFTWGEFLPSFNIVASLLVVGGLCLAIRLLIAKMPMYKNMCPRMEETKNKTTV